MIIERIVEFEVDPDEIAVFYGDEYQQFIMENDNEDTSDFLLYFIENFGFDVIISDFGLMTSSPPIDRIF